MAFVRRSTSAQVAMVRGGAVPTRKETSQISADPVERVVLAPTVGGNAVLPGVLVEDSLAIEGLVPGTDFVQATEGFTNLTVLQGTPLSVSYFVHGSLDATPEDLVDLAEDVEIADPAAGGHPQTRVRLATLLKMGAAS